MLDQLHGGYFSFNLRGTKGDLKQKNKKVYVEEFGKRESKIKKVNKVGRSCIRKRRGEKVWARKNTREGGKALPVRPSYVGGCDHDR